MSKLTQTGTLPIGLVVDGIRHTAFELRPATVGDNVEAFEELGEASPLRMSAAVYARQLVALGSLPKDRITTALVLGLSPEDFNALEEAQALLKKKQAEFGQPWPGGIPCAPSACATA